MIGGHAVSVDGYIGRQPGPGRGHGRGLGDAGMLFDDVTSAVADYVAWLTDHDR